MKKFGITDNGQFLPEGAIRETSEYKETPEANQDIDTAARQRESENAKRGVYMSAGMPLSDEALIEAAKGVKSRTELKVEYPHIEAWSKVHSQKGREPWSLLAEHYGKNAAEGCATASEIAIAVPDIRFWEQKLCNHEAVHEMRRVSKICSDSNYQAFRPFLTQGKGYENSSALKVEAVLGGQKFIIFLCGAPLEGAIVLRQSSLVPMHNTQPDFCGIAKATAIIEHIQRQPNIFDAIET